MNRVKGLVLVLIFFVIIAVCWRVCISIVQPKEPKYVFYFIGDGMGVNQVIGTEMYLAEMDGTIGVKSLSFSTFPVRNHVTTFSSLNGVTCSAAAGTALASGVKTANGTIGMDKTHTDFLESIAFKAKKNGKKVGIVTSVGMNHATPAAFYAHQPSRNMYYEIGLDAAKAGFDLYGGGSVLYPYSKNDSTATRVYGALRDSGYIIACGLQEFNHHMTQAQKLVLLRDTVNDDDATIGYAIDRRPDELTLAGMTKASVDFLTKNNTAGFFLMVEGGMIDYACHINDARTAFDETADFATAVQVAIDFYNRYPDETLIVVTADHETGGMILGTGRYELNLKILRHQKSSLPVLTNKIKILRKEKNNKVAWSELRQLLKDNLGFWDEIELSEADADALEAAYRTTFAGDPVEMEQTLYSSNEPIAVLAVKIINRMARISWASGGHSAGGVPVFALGEGAEHFSGIRDNTEIPKMISEIAGYN